MREEQLRLARRTHRQIGDVPGGNARIQLLPTVRFCQIKEYFLWQFTMARRTRGQKQQWISFVNLIPLFRLAEQLGAVSELRLKSVFDLGSDLIAAVPNSRANRRPELRRIASEMLAHLPDALFDNAFHRSAPPSVKNADRAMLGIDHDHGQAIRREHRKQQPRRVGYQAIASQRMCRSLRNAMNEVGMDLSQAHQVPARLVALSDHRHQSAAVLRNRRPLIVNGEAEIQAAFAVSPRDPSLSRAESVHKPGNTRQGSGLKDLNL
jgi:hypothetical protein